MDPDLLCLKTPQLGTPCPKIICFLYLCRSSSCFQQQVKNKKVLTDYLPKTVTGQSQPFESLGKPFLPPGQPAYWGSSFLSYSLVALEIRKLLEEYSDIGVFHSNQ